MNKVLKNVCSGMVTIMLCMGFVACSDSEEGVIEQKINAAGKWFVTADTYAQMLIINSDNSAFSTGVDQNNVWKGVYGKFGFEKDEFVFISENRNNSYGTFQLTDSHLTLTHKGIAYQYNKLRDDFTLTGKWKCSKSKAYIKAIKDELMLPVGAIVNGEEVPVSIPTKLLQGEFVEKAIEAYFRNVEFKNNGEMTYQVVKEGKELDMTKNYLLADNSLKVTGKVGSFEVNNQFMVFQRDNQKETYLFLTQENMADMFVGYGMMLREGNIAEGSIESLMDFRQAFMETFENFSAIICLERQ